MEQKEIRKHIGRALQKARKAAGWRSADEYASHMGLNTGTYTNYEQGRSSFNADQAWVFAEDLGCTVDELIGFDYSSRREYTDPLQALLNQYYTTLNNRKKATLVQFVQILSLPYVRSIDLDEQE